MSVHTLKLESLQERRDIAHKKFREAEGAKMLAIGDAAQWLQKMKELEEEIWNLKIKIRAPQVSDHAFLRYLERIMEFDLEEMKRQLLLKLPKQGLPDGKHRIDDVIFVSKDNVLITVIKPE